MYEHGHYRLNLEAGVSADISIFDKWAKAGDQEADAGNAADSALAYSRAVQLYSGDLIGGTDLHATVERERLRATYLTLLARLSDGHFEAGNYRACLDFARQLLTNDPCREDAHRMLMRCYVKLGERAQALRQFRMCQEILNSEFGAVPELATRVLFNQVRESPDNI